MTKYLFIALLLTQFPTTMQEQNDWIARRNNPLIPVPLSPTIGKTDVDFNITELVYQVIGAETCEVYFGVKGTLTRIAEKVPCGKQTLTEPLKPGVNYNWRVIGRNRSGVTAGPTWDFTTSSAPTPPEICGNNIDDNKNGQIDENPPCGPIEPPPQELCGPTGTGDGIDNDGDGLIDEGCSTGTIPNGLIGPQHMTLKCAFKVSDTFKGFGFGAVYNPANNSLFMTVNNQLTTEIGIPKDCSSSKSLADLPVAPILQQPVDATNGTLNNINPTNNPNGTLIGGYLIYQNFLYLDAYLYYDSGSQRSSHWRRPLNLSVSTQTIGPFDINVVPWGPGGAWVNGPMTVIPPEWRGMFGATALTGQCCIPIISRTSWGPAAVEFDPPTFPNATMHNMLLHYTQDHQLGNFEGQSELFSGPTQVHGVNFIDNTRSILYSGRQGTGPYCYGEGYPTQPVPPDNGDYHYCYDPAIADKGNHTYPYYYQIWAYDATDLLSVKNGSKQMWEPRPYAYWRPSLPFGIPNAELLGSAWDPSTRRLFLIQANGDGPRPVVYIFDIANVQLTTTTKEK